MTYQSQAEAVDAALSISLVPVRLALGILEDYASKGGWNVEHAFHRLVGPLESELGIAPVHNRVELTDADRTAVAKAASVSQGAVQDSLDVLRMYAAAKDDDTLLAQMDYHGSEPPLIPLRRDELLAACYQGLVQMFKEGAGIQNLTERFYGGPILTIQQKDEQFPDEQFPYLQKKLPLEDTFLKRDYLKPLDLKPLLHFFENSSPKNEIKYFPFNSSPQKTEQGTAPDQIASIEDSLRALSRILSSEQPLSGTSSLSNNSPPMKGRYTHQLSSSRTWQELLLAIKNIPKEK